MNLTTAIQSEISQILSTEDLTWLCEDSRNIEFEVKDALSRQGISPVIVVTQLDYQGHNGELEAYDASVELQVAENPAISRFYKDGKSAYDVVLDAVHRLCGYRSGIFGNWCPGTVNQQVENNLVVVRAEIFGTYAYKPQAQHPKWVSDTITLTWISTAIEPYDQFDAVEVTRFGDGTYEMLQVTLPNGLQRFELHADGQISIPGDQDPDVTTISFYLSSGQITFNKIEPNLT